MAKKAKTDSYRFGLLSEAFAANLLRLKGYRILEQRYKTKMGELDLVAKKGNTIAVVEVKGRGKITSEVVTKHQMRRVANAASLFVAKRKEFAKFNIRFDVILIVPWQLPKHITNAWDTTN